MLDKGFENTARDIFKCITKHYGISKYQPITPYLDILKDIEGDTKGEYCFLDNEIVIYSVNIENTEDLVKTLIHEYQHYLQSPRWFKRYYTMGYEYDNHPYELDAYREERNWNQIWRQA